VKRRKGGREGKRREEERKERNRVEGRREEGQLKGYVRRNERGVCVHFASLLFSSLSFLASLLSLTHEFYSELECVLQVLVLADFILLRKQVERKRGGRGQR
jgi:hypothetical protein